MGFAGYLPHGSALHRVDGCVVFGLFGGVGSRFILSLPPGSTCVSLVHVHNRRGRSLPLSLHVPRKA